MRRPKREDPHRRKRNFLPFCQECDLVSLVVSVGSRFHEVKVKPYWQNCSVFLADWWLVLAGLIGIIGGEIALVEVEK